LGFINLKCSVSFNPLDIRSSTLELALCRFRNHHRWGTSRYH